MSHHGNSQSAWPSLCRVTFRYAKRAINDVWDLPLTTSSELADSARRLRVNLHEAPAAPAPGLWHDRRRMSWINWGLTRFVDARHAYREGNAQPVDKELLGRWHVLLSERAEESDDRGCTWATWPDGHERQLPHSRPSIASPN
jgi:hypothetical protein